MNSAPAETESSQRSPFATLLRAEFARAFRLRHVVAAAALAAMGLVLAFWLPLFPESVRQFFARVFQLDTWPQIVVANELTGILFFVFWVGAFDVFTIYVVPREEGHLDLYLAKPLTRQAYMLARMIPIMVTMSALGAFAALVLWVALAPVGLSFPVLSYLGASAVVIAWTACLVAITNLIVLAVRETYSAALLAFAVMVIAILPGSIYMYRPDVFAEAPLMRALIVFPLTLLWHQDFTAGWGLPLAALLLAIAVALVAASAWRINAADVR